MYLADKIEEHKLRFILRDGKQVLQERLRERRQFKEFVVWRDVPIEQETGDEEIEDQTVCD